MKKDITIDLNTKRPICIAVISKNDYIVEEISAIVQSLPNMTTESQRSTLSGMNGAAVSFVSKKDLVIFEMDSEKQDLTVVANIRAELDRGVTLLALTREDISLADARRLTRAGVDDVLTYPFDVAELRDQLERKTRPNTLVPVKDEGGTKQAKVIAIAKSRGGAGATTIAVNLAEQLQRRKGIVKKVPTNRVCLVDLDFQFGDVANFLDIEPRNTLFQMAVDGIIPDINFLRQSISTTSGDLDVLTAPEKFAPNEALKIEQVQAILQHLKGDYDYVVVDMPMVMVDWVSAILEECDRMLMVTDSSVPSIAQARRMIDFYTTEVINLPIEIIINCERKPLMKSGALKEAEKVLERPIAYWVPEDRKSARAAIDHGLPIADIAKRSAIAKSIKALATKAASDLASNAPQLARKG